MYRVEYELLEQSLLCLMLRWEINETASSFAGSHLSRITIPDLNIVWYRYPDKLVNMYNAEYRRFINHFMDNCEYYVVMSKC